MDQESVEPTKVVLLIRKTTDSTRSLAEIGSR